MPTYDYVCSSCSNQWEEIQKISADPIEVCPKCGKSTAKRQISGGNFILKGGGWYADLYSSTPKSKPESAGSGSSSSASSSSSAEASSSAGSASSSASSSSGGQSSSSGSSPSGGGSSSGASTK